MVRWKNKGSQCKFQRIRDEQMQNSSWFFSFLYRLCGLPWWLSGKRSTCQCVKCWLDPWIGKLPWRRKGQPTPVFLLGESQGQRRLVGYSPWGHKELGMTERLNNNYRLSNPCQTVCWCGLRQRELTNKPQGEDGIGHFFFLFRKEISLIWLPFYVIDLLLCK